MKIKDFIVGTFAAAVLAAALVSTPAIAVTGSNSGFAALQNVEAQSLTAAELQAITGEFNAAGIAAALLAQAAASHNRRVAAALTNLANFVTAHAAEINARLMQWHLYTP